MVLKLEAKTKHCRLQHNSKLETSGIGDGTDYEWIDFLFWIDDQYEICRKEHKTDYVLPNIFNGWLYKKYLGEAA
ncbi:MAG: hypothetical protein WBH77_10000 [Saccharofermentanales bacterium]